jgi:hypothetical protein
MRRSIVLADIRLELDDAGRSPDRAVVADQQSAEQRPPELERRQVEDVAKGACYDPDTRT